MGCDTKGYIKNIEFLPLLGIVHEVLHKGPEFHEFRGVELCGFLYGDDLTSGRTTFVYDTAADMTNPWRPTYSKSKEDRQLWVHSSVDDDPTVVVDWDTTDVHPGPEVLYGSVSLGMWGSATEIITKILLKAKEAGYEVWLLECDCDGIPVKL